MLIRDKEVSLNLDEIIEIVPEGRYVAVIADATFEKDVPTKYGFTNVININLDLKVAETDMRLVSKVFVSNSANSSCMQMLNAFYNGSAPEEVEISEWVGKSVEVFVKHRTSQKGKEYAYVETYGQLSEEELPFD